MMKKVYFEIEKKNKDFICFVGKHTYDLQNGDQRHYFEVFFNVYAHGGETENICVWEREKKTLVVVRAK